MNGMPYAGGATELPTTPAATPLPELLPPLLLVLLFMYLPRSAVIAIVLIVVIIIIVVVIITIIIIIVIICNAGATSSGKPQRCTPLGLCRVQCFSHEIYKATNKVHSASTIKATATAEVLCKLRMYTGSWRYTDMPCVRLIITHKFLWRQLRLIKANTIQVQQLT